MAATPPDTATPGSAEADGEGGGRVSRGRRNLRRRRGTTPFGVPTLGAGKAGGTEVEGGGVGGGVAGGAGAGAEARPGWEGGRGARSGSR